MGSKTTLDGAIGRCFGMIEAEKRHQGIWEHALLRKIISVT
jgi:hypothetical protein